MKLLARITEINVGPRLDERGVDIFDGQGRPQYNFQTANVYAVKGTYVIDGLNPDYIAVRDSDEIPSGYEDVSSLGSWAMHGHAVKLRDWRQLRTQIILAFGEWGQQSDEAKRIACAYAPNRFEDHLPEVFGTGDADETKAAIDGVIALWRTKSRQARKQRYDTAETRLFVLFGKAVAYVIGKQAKNLGLIADYLDFGIETQLEDTQPGLLDWLAGTDIYATDQQGGMKDMVIEGITQDQLNEASTQLLAIFNGDY